MGIRSMPFFKGKKGFQFAGGGNIDEYGDLPIATTSSAGCVKPDGTTINVTAQGGISVPTGSDTAKGIFQVDNETIKVDNGVLSTDALIKVATLPVASATTLGKIFMYTGATGGGLTSGHIYKCTSAGDPAVYSWTELPVQDVSALAPKTDLSAVIATGTTNETGSQIDAGTYFYLNGDYCVAKTNIAANATFTLNTNYEVVTVGGVLSELNSKLYSNLTSNVPIKTNELFLGKPVYLKMIEVSEHTAGKVDYFISEGCDYCVGAFAVVHDSLDSKLLVNPAWISQDAPAQVTACGYVLSNGQCFVRLQSTDTIHTLKIIAKYTLATN